MITENNDKPRACTLRAIPGSGSDRRYFILTREGEPEPVVVTYGTNQRENIAFIYLSRFFWDHDINVPLVLNHKNKRVNNLDKGLHYYSQTYVGSRSLFDYLKTPRESGAYQPWHIDKLKAAMQLIASIHAIKSYRYEEKYFYPKARMDTRMVRYDLNYFKYCFLKMSGVEFEEDYLQDDFDRLEKLLMINEPRWDSFMYRDFQSRNVMISDDGKEIFGIDFQGGRIGPGEYDVASFLWQAKAAYPQWLKDELFDHYLKCRKEKDSDFIADEFKRDFKFFVLFRVLQTLGAYGFRGWVERKPHFLNSIKAGIRNLKEITSAKEIMDEFPYLADIAEELFDKYGQD